MKSCSKLVIAALVLLVCGCRDKEEKVSKFSIRNNGKEKGPSSGFQNADLSSIGKLLDRSRNGELVSDEEYGRIKKRLETLSKEDLYKLLDQTSDNRNSPQNRPFFTLAVTELAGRDPKAAMDWFSPEKMKPGEAGFMAVASVLGKSAPDVLQDWLKQNRSKGSSLIQNECLRISLSAISNTDANSAFRFYLSENWNTVSHGEIINAVFWRFGQQAPLAAEAAAESKFAGRDLDLARYNISNGAGRLDPLLAIEIAKKIGDSELRGRAISAKLSTLIASDPTKAIGQLNSLDSKELQIILQSDVGNKSSLVNVLGEANPDLLSNLLGKMVISSSNEGLFMEAIKCLAIKSPDKVSEILETLPEGTTKRKMISSQFDALASENSTLAIETASKIADQETRIQAYGAIGQTVGRRDLNSILKTAETLSALDANALVSAALPSLTDQNPKAAAELLLSRKFALAGNQNQAIIERIGMRLSNQDQSYAQQWIGKLPENDQPYAMKGVAAEMAKSDIQGLSVMLGSLPQDKNWEAGVKVLIQNISDSDPQMAKKWQDALVTAGFK